MTPTPIPVVCSQHVAGVHDLRRQRRVVVRAPHVSLRHLARLDERIAAHVDGIGVAGAALLSDDDLPLDEPEAVGAFTLAVASLACAQVTPLRRLASLDRAVPAMRTGLASALAWMPSEAARAEVARLLSSRDADAVSLALWVCRLTGSDPGVSLRDALRDDATVVLLAAVRLAATLGRIDLTRAVADLMDHDEPTVRATAAQAAALLGDRSALALRFADGSTRPGWSLPIQASGFAAAGQRFRSSTAEGSPSRRMVIEVGAHGDAALVPWLMDLMSVPPLARLAAESFTLITGADLAALDLETKPPEHPVAGPTDDPDDDVVALDEDEHLPWPDVAKVHAWWKAHAHRFPANQRCFVGGPITSEHMLHVLKTGTQRQRALAATWRCLLRPGTPLFNIAAPAWRQQRELAALR